DAGSDKPLQFIDAGHEENPALGVRGFRAIRINRELLQRQLQALSEAAAATPQTTVWVMAPMVSTSAEAAQFAKMAQAAGVTTRGVMVEVPGAALCTDALLESIEFASLGTNDLAQY